MSKKDRFVVQSYVLSVLWMIGSLQEGAEVLAVLAMVTFALAALISLSN